MRGSALFSATVAGWWKKMPPDPWSQGVPEAYATDAFWDPAYAEGPKQPTHIVWDGSASQVDSSAGAYERYGPEVPAPPESTFVAGNTTFMGTAFQPGGLFYGVTPPTTISSAASDGSAAFSDPSSWATGSSDAMRARVTPSLSQSGTHYGVAHVIPSVLGTRSARAGDTPSSTLTGTDQNAAVYNQTLWQSVHGLGITIPSPQEHTLQGEWAGSSAAGDYMISGPEYSRLQRMGAVPYGESARDVHMLRDTHAASPRAVPPRSSRATPPGLDVGSPPLDPMQGHTPPSLERFYPGIALVEANERRREAEQGRATSTPSHLRPLSLVDKHFGTPTPRPPETLSASTQVSTRTFDALPDPTRTISAGALHHLEMTPESLSPGVVLPPAPPATHLRPLQLPQQQGAATSCRRPHGASHTPDMAPWERSGWPRLGGEPVRAGEANSQADETHSTASTGSRSRRVPYAVLHPPKVRQEVGVEARSLFWAGFVGMPWLWLLGGWCTDDHGALVVPWSTPSFAAYRHGFHPYGPPFALTSRARDNLAYHGRTSPTPPRQAAPLPPGAEALGEDHKGVRFFVQKGAETKAASTGAVLDSTHWSHIERFVLYNRIAAALAALVISACWSTGIWAIVSHF